MAVYIYIYIYKNLPPKQLSSSTQEANLFKLDSNAETPNYMYIFLPNTTSTIATSRDFPLQS